MGHTNQYHPQPQPPKQDYDHSAWETMNGNAATAGGEPPADSAYEDGVDNKKAATTPKPTLPGPSTGSEASAHSNHIKPVYSNSPRDNLVVDLESDSPGKHIPLCTPSGVDHREQFALMVTSI